MGPTIDISKLAPMNDILISKVAWIKSLKEKVNIIITGPLYKWKI